MQMEGCKQVQRWVIAHLVKGISSYLLYATNRCGFG
jgi:hypothetical protein